jgi:hypothetical protein
MARPVHKAEFREGPEAAKGFDMAMKRILSVSPEEMRRRLAVAAKKKASSRDRVDKD